MVEYLGNSQHWIKMFGVLRTATTWFSLENWSFDFDNWQNTETSISRSVCDVLMWGLNSRWECHGAAGVMYPAFYSMAFVGDQKFKVNLISKLEYAENSIHNNNHKSESHCCSATHSLVSVIITNLLSLGRELCCCSTKLWLPER